MTPENLQKIKQAQAILAVIMVWLKRAFDITANWVTQLSWWKFFIFAIVTLICGAILQDAIFSEKDVPVPNLPKRVTPLHANPKAHSYTDGDTHVTIDSNGITHLQRQG